MAAPSSVDHAWQFWFQRMREQYGEPPPNAIPLLKMTFFTGALAAAAMCNEGMDPDVIAAEIIAQGEVENARIRAGQPVPPEVPSL
jgi:hypothetical protein